ncbi:MAG: 3-hydroxyacyl-[acyl-carrier-protein] dehydratase FabZ [Nitrosomonadaceae bacterium]|jgi:3-hydroxyacyl-[acyl-carrier-protein] dehydratase|uniref:3-hydroxyacyl-ACP dehydratase FabZ n=2 Tax=Nitrosomonadaceae TaxID=206379 RepID=UPI000D441594|nr:MULTISPECIES: 3-hydroxyacyl-ACP dehydratase FabZ [Nitrosomonas]NBQ69856.1 3-hydroxyacyl-[acyl-carrier-protein] dehydratase FabZ [Nitrosomonadaceae bacterium]MCG7756401.1 3-hydroxyacyl-ACP dehydratase FabZ [Nitrosomonas sp.]MDV6340214.1 3-hydroxyacyl-ACP dehydratase FabZ [Nitrosomonas sp. Is24]MDV6345958.1 3-hydroxyacyl-ACP dehydratase FabZ [Nitrosomonas sp. Is35]MXS83129.1 3-hydroxyacyl-[acyl-carrier-protein] dehydratase FabZ [Nitrosomonas oligotropha]
MSTMNIHEILKYLPHRYPILLVDRVISYEAGKDIVALKNVSINEPFFSGHFPHHPVMPGVLIVEALAQAAAILTLRTEDTVNKEDTVYYFVGIDGVRFKKPVIAGDQLILKVAIERQIKGLWKYSARAEVDGQLVTEAQLMCTSRSV